MHSWHMQGEMEESGVTKDSVYQIASVRGSSTGQLSAWVSRALAQDWGQAQRPW